VWDICSLPVDATTAAEHVWLAERNGLVKGRFLGGSTSSGERITS